MKRWTLGLFLLFLGLALGLGSAWAASGYRAVVESDGSTMGILVYYADSAMSYAPQFNSMLDSVFSEADLNVYEHTSTSAEDVLNRAMTIMNQGCASQGWDACFGLVVYRTVENGVSVLKTDIYALGMEMEGQRVPYFYLGSVSLSEQAMSYLQ